MAEVVVVIICDFNTNLEEIRDFSFSPKKRGELLIQIDAEDQKPGSFRHGDAQLVTDKLDEIFGARLFEAVDVHGLFFAETVGTSHSFEDHLRLTRVCS